MDRRQFLKTTIITSLSNISCLSAANALSLTSTIKNIKRRITERHLDELTFASIYPKPIYEKSYFDLIVLGASIVAAGIVSYFTAGAGAPAAATGVSTVASWIGGGGAGSYMAGLSTVGSWFGGNAMLGAAILNGISLGTIGTASGKAALSLAAKAATVVDWSLSGVSFIKSIKDEKGVYVFDIKIPRDLGSGTVRRLVDTIYKLEDEKQNAIKDKLFEKANGISRQIDVECRKGVELLKKEFLKARPSQENLLVLGILSYRIGNIKYFSQALQYIPIFYNPKKDSFLDYLRGINELSNPKSQSEDKALEYFINSYEKEPYTIEPIIATISLLGENYQKNKKAISEAVRIGAENYDPDKYTGRPLIALYSRAAIIAFNNQDWKSALEYYSKEYDELGIIVKTLPIAKEIKNHIKMQMAICYKHLGNLKKAQNLKEEVLENCETENCKKQYERLFTES